MQQMSRAAFQIPATIVIFIFPHSPFAFKYTQSIQLEVYIYMWGIKILPLLSYQILQAAASLYPSNASQIDY